MSDNKFIDGLIIKPPHEKAPEYVKAKISIKVQELCAWLGKQQGDWVNLDVKVSQQGKWYAAIDDWKPNGQRGGGERGRDTVARQRQAAGNAPDDDFDDAIHFN